MSQINVNKVISPSQAGSDGPSLDIASNGNISADTNTLFVDSSNNRFGVGTSTPIRTLDLSGTGGALFGGGVLLEKCNIPNAAITGNVNHDLVDGHVQSWNTASGAFTINARFSSSVSVNNGIGVGQTFTITDFVPVTVSNRYCTEFRVDGAAQTVQWVGAWTPNQTGSEDEAATTGTDIYTFQVTKTASATYTVLGSLSHFGAYS